MFLVESKLRNLIRSVIVESLLKEENEEEIIARKKSFLSRLIKPVEELQKMQASAITKEYFETLMLGKNDVKDDPVYNFCILIATSRTFLKKILNHTSEDDGRLYSATSKIFRKIDIEYYENIKSAIEYIRKKYVIPYVHGQNLEKLKQKIDNPDFNQFITFFTRLLPEAWAETQQKFNIDGVDGLNALKDSDVDEFINCFQFMLSENANGETAKGNASMYFGNAFQVIKLITTQLSEYIRSYRDSKEEEKKKQFKENIIKKLNLILQDKKLMSRLNRKKMQADIDNFSKNSSTFTPAYPLQKLLDALKDDSKKNELIDLINSDDNNIMRILKITTNTKK